MFERYTEKARRVVYFSRKFATELGGNYIEPEHILLAILQEEPELFRSLLIAPAAAEDLRARVEQAARQWPQHPEPIDIPLSPSSKRVLAHGAEDAGQQRRRKIRPGHLLIGLLREESSEAAKALQDAGITVEDVHTIVDNTPEVLTNIRVSAAADLHRMIDELPPEQWDRARAMLRTLIATG
jgi:ATP-dependent Clp protease ATP-binding subunit ClpC